MSGLINDLFNAAKQYGDRWGIGLGDAYAYNNYNPPTYSGTGYLYNRNNLLTNKRMNSQYYYKKRYYRKNYWTRRNYYRKKTLNATAKSVYYKSDFVVTLRYQGTTSSPQINKKYLNKDGLEVDTNNDTIGFDNVIGKRGLDLIKNYTNVRIRGISFEWIPNVTGLSSTSSYPLMSCIMNYPFDTVASGLSYYSAMDQEKIVLMGSMKSYRFFRYFQKYEAVLDFQSSILAAKLQFYKEMASANMPIDTVIGQLKIRTFLMMKGNKF